MVQGTDKVALAHRAGSRRAVEKGVVERSGVRAGASLPGSPLLPCGLGHVSYHLRTPFSSAVQWEQSRSFNNCHKDEMSKYMLRV